MKKITFKNAGLLLICVLLGIQQNGFAQQDIDCFDMDPRAFIFGAWYGDGNLNSAGTVLSIQTGVPIDKLKAAAEQVDGISFASGRSFNIVPGGQFANFDPYYPTPNNQIKAAPDGVLHDRNSRLSWLMAVIYGEGQPNWKQGDNTWYIDDEHAHAVPGNWDTPEKRKRKRAYIDARLDVVEEVADLAGFDARRAPQGKEVFIDLETDEDAFLKVLRLPFGTWKSRVPGNPANVADYPSCDDNPPNPNNPPNAYYDEELGRVPGSIIRMSVLDNDKLGDGSQATLNTVTFDLNLDKSGIQDRVENDKYLWKINSFGKLVFKPKIGYTRDRQVLRYKVIENSTQLSDIVHAKVGYSQGQGITSLQSAVYPNPLPRGGDLNIEPLLMNEGSSSVEVVDMNGRLVQSERMNPGGNTLDTAGLTPGMYILKVHTLNGTETVQFVVE